MTQDKPLVSLDGRWAFLVCSFTCFVKICAFQPGASVHSCFRFFFSKICASAISNHPNLPPPQSSASPQARCLVRISIRYRAAKQCENGDMIDGKLCLRSDLLPLGGKTGGYYFSWSFCRFSTPLKHSSVCACSLHTFARAMESSSFVWAS